MTHATSTLISLCQAYDLAQPVIRQPEMSSSHSWFMAVFSLHPHRARAERWRASSRVSPYEGINLIHKGSIFMTLSPPKGPRMAWEGGSKHRTTERMTPDAVIAEHRGPWWSVRGTALWLSGAWGVTYFRAQKCAFRWQPPVLGCHREVSPEAL